MIDLLSIQDKPKNPKKLFKVLKFFKSSNIQLTELNKIKN